MYIKRGKSVTWATILQTAVRNKIGLQIHFSDPLPLFGMVT